MPDSIDRWNVRRTAQPLLARDGEYSQLAGLVQLQDVARHDGNHRGDLTGDHIVSCRPMPR